TPPKAPAEKMYSFGEMRDKPWPQVLEWLADQTGLPYIGAYKPTGTFTYIAPRGKPDKLTLPQVIDILNEALSSQKYLLIRRTQSFTMVPSDEKVSADILPRLTER